MAPSNPSFATDSEGGRNSGKLFWCILGPVSRQPRPANPFSKPLIPVVDSNLPGGTGRREPMLKLWLDGVKTRKGTSNNRSALLQWFMFCSCQCYGYLLPMIATLAGLPATAIVLRLVCHRCLCLHALNLIASLKYFVPVFTGCRTTMPRYVARRGIAQMCLCETKYQGGYRIILWE